MAGTRDFEILIFFENVRAAGMGPIGGPLAAIPFGVDIAILDIISV